MTIITSRGNARVARARGLRRRAERDLTGLYLVEGIRGVVQAAECEAELEELIVAPELLRSEVALRLVERMRRQGVPVLDVTASVFESLSSRDGPQGIAAVARQRWLRLADADPHSGLCWVALDAVQDPGNLGAILRTCDAVGAAGVILLGDSADPYDPSAVRASTGAVLTQQLVRTDLDELIAWKHERRAMLVGTSDRAEADYRAHVYQPPLVVSMGGEQKGLSERALAACDAVVSIPMLGSCDSLNLAVAAGVVLYEALGQRRGDAPTTRRSTGHSEVDGLRNADRRRAK